MFSSCLVLAASWLPPSPVTSDMTPRWEGMPQEEVVTVRNTTKSQHSTDFLILLTSQYQYLLLLDANRFTQSRRSLRFAKKQAGERIINSVQISIECVELQPTQYYPSSQMFR